MGSSPNLLGFCILILLVCNVNWCESINCSCKQHERNALLSFQKAHMPKGSSSNRLKSWSGDDCCTWEGVGCSNLTCHVVSLNLGEYGDINEVLHPVTMNDILTSTLTQLRNLEYLDLSGTRLSRRSDDTPKELNGKVMNQLRHLDLSFTGLEGQIPHQLGNLSNLQVLDLSYTNLYDHTGFRWVFGLRKLQSLNLTYVDLSLLPTNSIHELHRLSTLQELILPYCQLSQDQFLQFLSNSSFLSTSSLKVLNLNSNYLESPIPHTLSNLSSLQSLGLGGNNLNSTVPSFLGSMRSLQQLGLSSNYFSSVEGGIVGLIEGLCGLNYLDFSFNNLQDRLTARPLKFSRCNTYDLETLYLQSNHISGGLEWLGNFSSLKYIRLGDNHFSGTIPTSLGRLSSLQNLVLSDNNFNGAIPSTLGQLSSLTYLDLSQNNFAGTIPSTLGQLSSLTSLDLSVNHFNGTIPSTLGQLSSLTSLDLSNNNFTGTIPSALGQLSSLTSLQFLSNSSFLSTSSLKVLDLSENILEGPIPHTLSNLSSLQYLDLGGNNFSSTVPSFLGQLSSLTYLDLSNNNFTGTIPSALGQLSSLTSLDLSNNNFTGTIPSTLGQLSSLTDLLLSYNNFTGTIPSTLGQLSSLTSLHLSNNNFTGTIPSVLGQLSSLYFQSLSNNNFTGTIPSTLGQLSSLQDLDLSKNRLTGVLPDHILRHWPSLEYLNLAYNHLNGTIPISLCNLQMIVDMKSNRFTGQIPDCSSRNITIGWEMVDLSSNSLSGRVPSFLWEIPHIYLLNLSNNTLKGELPITISKSLEILDLGENDFYGKIPSWHQSMLGDYLNLIVLRLRSNHLVGMVPLQMCSFDNLQIIDLANNHLTGPIPKCFGNLSGMCSVNPYYPFKFGSEFMSSVESINGIEQEYTKNLQFLVNLDLSRNHFSGSIPVQLTKLQGLKGLNVSHNQLTGKIPSQIGRMKSMVSLDLSENNLQGSIPQGLADLTFLSSLNLSYNKLHGPIPTGNQLSNIIDPSIYAGNVNLCGDMLPKKCSTSHEKNPTKMALDEDHNGNDTFENLWFLGFLVLGTIIGFWGVIGILNVKQGWR